MHLPTLTLALYALVATASPTSPLETRQGTTLGSLTCGTTSYTKKQVDDAVAEGCRLYASREQLGTSKYPHQFNNREALVFAASGPYQEFPILEGGRLYSGSMLPRCLVGVGGGLTYGFQERLARTAWCLALVTRATVSMLVP